MILKEYKYRYKNNPKPRCAASSALPADAELALKGAAGLGVDLVEILQISAIQLYESYRMITQQIHSNKSLVC